jgi:hypothetical protein
MKNVNRERYDKSVENVRKRLLELGGKDGFLYCLLRRLHWWLEHSVRSPAANANALSCIKRRVCFGRRKRLRKRVGGGFLAGIAAEKDTWLFSYIKATQVSEY